MQYIKVRKKFIFIYTCSFLLIGGGIFLPFVLKGNTFVSNVDGFNQYYPAFVYIGRYIRECFKEFTIKQFDFTIGLGEGIIPALNYYGFGDPLNLFSALVPIDYAPIAFTFLILLRIYLCGISMAFFCRRNRKSWDSCLLAALVYAFSSFILIYGLQFYTYITGAAILPLILTGVNEIIEEKKKISNIFIFAIFLQAINSFYFLYMDTIFIFFYTLVFCDPLKQKDKKTNNRIFFLLIQYILGLCVGGIVLLPSIYGFLGSTRTGGGSMSIRSMLFYNIDTYKEYLGNLFISKAYSSSSLAIPIIELLCCIIFLCGHKKKNKWRVLCIGAMVGYFLPIVGYAMNGFSYATDRWVYILHFIFAVSMIEVLEKEDYVVGKKQCLIYSIFIFFSILIHLSTNNGKETYIRIFIYLLLVVLVPFLFTIKWFYKKWIIIIFIVGNIALNGFMIYGPVSFGGSGFSSSFMTLKELKESFQGSKAGKLQQDSVCWSRADVYETSYGAAMAMGFRGCAEYLSILNKNISLFYQNLDISSGMRGSSWTLSGLDGRKNIEDILSVNEYLKPIKKGGIIEYEMEQNSDFLPLGFTYNSYITKENFQKMKTPDKDIAILQAVVLDKEIEKDWDQIYITDIVDKSSQVKSTIDYENMYITGNEFTTQKDSKIEIRIENLLPGELYVTFNNLYYLSDFSREIIVENKILQVLNKGALQSYFGNDVCNYSVKIDLPENKSNIELCFLPEKKYTLEGINVYVRPVESDNYFREKLSEDVLYNLNVSFKGEVEGNLNIDKNKILFLSIPYSKGWTAYVNGEEKEIQRANIGFCGIPLEAGCYRIKLIYQTPGLMFGSLLTFVGLMIWFIFYLLESKKFVPLKSQ